LSMVHLQSPHPPTCDILQHVLQASNQANHIFNRLDTNLQM
jgi:hypothetical protein